MTKRGDPVPPGSRSRRGGMDWHQLRDSLLRLAASPRAQDMVEYALIAGFIAIAAAAVLPGVASALSQIFSKMASLTEAGAKN